MARTKDSDKISALSEVGLFRSCSKRELQQAAELCYPLSVDEGFVLMNEGSAGRECFVVGDGQAEVTIADRPVGMVGPGECVGEIALLDRGPRTATVTARTPMTLYVQSTSEFQSLLNLSPVIASRIAASLARRLRAVEANHETMVGSG